MEFLSVTLPIRDATEVDRWGKQPSAQKE